MTRFEERNGSLYINGRKVLRAWESFSGWYWFAVEKVQEQVSDINGFPVPDVIWYGLVQGHVDEWGEFSEAELKALAPRVWELPQKAIVWSGRRE